MKKKNILVVIGVTLAVLLLAGTVYIYFHNKSINNSQSINKDNFALTYNYIGNNTWEYTVAGQLPTPCYDANVEAIVMESYPEQVSIKVTPIQNNTIGVCTTVVKDFTYDGTFNASSFAKISLSVEE